jgi:hypothetical protein
MGKKPGRKKPAMLDGQLRQAMVDSGKAVTELAELAGLADHGSVSRFLAGKRTLRLDVAAKIAAALGLELRKRG